MLTGDAKETAIAISRQICLLSDKSTARGSALSGSEIDRLSEADLKTVVKSASVFYRVTPRHKVRIVKALQVTKLRQNSTRIWFFIRSLIVKKKLEEKMRPWTYKQ